MAVWKKTLLALVPVAIAAYLGSTWMLGRGADALIAESDARMERELPFLRFSERKIEKGFFQSSETVRISPNMPGGMPGADDVSFALKSTIRHGPIPGLSGFAAANVDSELSLHPASRPEVKGVLGMGPLLAAHTTFKLGSMDGESLVTSPKFAAPGFSWDGMTMKVSFSKDVSRVSVQADIPRVHMGPAGGPGLDVSGMHYESDQKLLFSDDPTLYGGTAGVAIARIDFNPGAAAPGTAPTMPVPPFQGPTLSARDLKAAQTITLSGNEYLDFAQQGSLGTLEVNGQNYGPAHLDISGGHLHARTLSELARMARESWSQPLAPTPPSPALAGKIERLIQHMALKIDRLSFTTPQGEAALTASLAARDQARIDFNAPDSLIRIFNLRLDASAPEEFVKNSMMKLGPAGQPEDQANSRLQDAIAHGYLIRDGAMVKTSYEFKDNQHLLNGQPYEVPQPQAAVQPPDPGAALLLTKQYNCVACHAMSHKVVGPSWVDIAAKYKGVTEFEYFGHSYPLVEGLTIKVSRGGAGHWGSMPMPANDPSGTHQNDMNALVRYVLNVSR